MTRTLRRPATTAASLAASVVLALGLTACGSDDDSDAGDAAPSSSATSASTSASSTPSPTESDAADDSTDDSSAGGAAAPDDAQTVSTLGVSFAVPDDYLVLDAEEVFASGGNDEVINDLADKLGVTPEQLRQQFQNVDLLAADRDTEAGEFTDNVNALDTGATSLPTTDQAQSSFEQLGFTVTGSEEVSTPVGDGLLVSYDGQGGGLDFSGRGLFVDVDGTVVNITVSAGDSETADENADLITSTLAPAA